MESTQLTMSYHSDECIFKIVLQRDSVSCTIAISASAADVEEDNEASLQSAFIEEPVVARAYIKSKYLQEAIDEFQGLGGASELVLSMSPSSLILHSEGDTGTCMVELPRSRALFSSLETFPPTTHSRSYSLKLFLSGMSGLPHSKETCIQINRIGVCAVQHQIVDLVGRASFVDFIIGCKVEEYNDDDDDDNVSQSHSQNIDTQYSVGDEDNDTFDGRGTLRNSDSDSDTDDAMEFTRRKPPSQAMYSENYNYRPPMDRRYADRRGGKGQITSQRYSDDTSDDDEIGYD